MKKSCFSTCFNLLWFLLIFTACRNEKNSSGEWNGIQVPEGFSIEPAVDSASITYPMFASFDNRGRLFVCESTGETFSTDEHLQQKPYHIRLLEDEDGDGQFEKSTIFADSLTYPKGAVFFQGSLYVASAPDLLKLTDTDGDGVADQREVLLSGWVLNANAAAFGGPFFGPDGWLYLTDARRSFAISTREGKQIKGKGARIWRCKPDGSRLEWISGGGFDNAVELVFMPGGETIGTMTYFTDPMNGFRDGLMHWVYGGVYPKPQQVIEDDRLKLTGDLMPVLDKLPRIAHSGLMRYEGASFGESYTGNLFSAQFNTGRILRHIINAEGATYRTSDEPFMTTTNPDIHPTDVLEDGDGSILVVNTGGWFIAGCPLSVVAKKDVRGTIYRIRKTGAKKVDDPWGRKLNITSMNPGELVSYVSDSRPAVRNQAIEQLALIGEGALPDIRQSLLSSPDETIRTAAVFILYRINHPESLSLVRNMLNDSSSLVRTAAARVAGLAKDTSSVASLMHLVQTDVAAVRRQAATALGQIGNPAAVGALVKASSNPDDRFVEHAIIYSLITLQIPQPLIAALQDTAVNIRKAALIALDQMDDSPLEKKHLVPFLNSNQTDLQQAGIWVAGYHPDWADVVIDFLGKHLRQLQNTRTQETPVRDLMIAFSSNAGVQQFISTQLKNSSLPLSGKLSLIEVMQHADLDRLPDIWLNILPALLKSEVTEIRLAALNFIKSRRISAVNPELNRLTANEKLPADFRIKALSARLMSDPHLSEPAFQLITGFLMPGNPSHVRQEASSLLAQARLSEAQLVILAKEQITTADVFLLSDLVSAFKGGNSEEAGKALVEALGNAGESVDNLSVADMQQIFESYPLSVREASAPLIQLLKEKQASRLMELETLQAQLKRGDVANGRAIFFGSGTCMSCHAVGGEGGAFGPDLSNIGEIRSRHDILEAIMYPDASFAREHETSKIITRQAAYTGIITEQLPDAIIIATGPGSQVRVSRTEIISIEPQTNSMMPPGLLKHLNVQEISDLMAYLETLPDGLGQIKHHE